MPSWFHHCCYIQLFGLLFWFSAVAVTYYSWLQAMKGWKMQILFDTAGMVEQTSCGPGPDLGADWVFKENAVFILLFKDSLSYHPYKF